MSAMYRNRKKLRGNTARGKAVPAPQRSPSVDAFVALFGVLAGTKAFEGDAVEIQREMRDEWQSR